MRSFDYPQDFLEFEVHGQRFNVKTVAPEVIAAWDDAPAEDEETAFEKLDKMILTFIDDGNGQADRWRELRASADKPLAVGQMRGILRWMVESQSDFPTEQPASSPRGRGKTAAASGGE